MVPPAPLAFIFNYLQDSLRYNEDSRDELYICVFNKRFVEKCPAFGRDYSALLLIDVFPVNHTNTHRHGYLCACVCFCMYVWVWVFIKLHITSQFNPVVRIFQSYSYLVLPVGHQ